MLLIKKYRPSLNIQSDSIAGFHLTSLEFPYLGIRHIGAPDP